MLSNFSHFDFLLSVQDLHRLGHEIGVFSITNNEDPKYWTEGNYDTWLGEMAGPRYKHFVGTNSYTEKKVSYLVMKIQN